MRWVMFQGAPVYLEQQTINRIVNLGGKLTEMKESHIPPFKPKAASFTLEEVNAIVKAQKKTSKGKEVDIEVAEWAKLMII